MGSRSALEKDRREQVQTASVPDPNQPQSEWTGLGMRLYKSHYFWKYALLLYILCGWTNPLLSSFTWPIWFWIYNIVPVSCNYIAKKKKKKVVLRVQANSLVNKLDKRLNANIVTEEVTHHLHQWAVDLDCLFKELAQLTTTTDYTRI